MSTNIMDLVKGAVSDQIMGQLGGLLGTDAKKTPSLFETATGAILGGLMKKGSTAQGAKDIFGAVEKQDDSILDKLGDLMGGGDATDGLQNQGSSILDMVMGGSQQSAGMIDMVAKALGLDKGVVGKLLMMAAPILMGVIGKYIKREALDAVGLGNLLGEQKSNLGFMPSSLTSDLGFDDMLGKAGDLAGAASDSVGNVAGAASGMANDAAKSSGSLLKYIIPIGILAVAGLFLGPQIIDMMSKSPHMSGPDEVTASPIPTLEGMDYSTVPSLDALGETGETLFSGFTEITTGLNDVSDDAGANRLAEKITSFTGQIDGLGLDKFEGVAKKATATIIRKFGKAVLGLLTGKSEGIQGILKPVIDTLLEKLSPFKVIPEVSFGR